MYDTNRVIDWRTGAGPRRRAHGLARIIFLLLRSQPASPLLLALLDERATRYKIPSHSQRAREICLGIANDSLMATSPSHKASRELGIVLLIRPAVGIATNVKTKQRTLRCLEACAVAGCAPRKSRAL